MTYTGNGSPPLCSRKVRLSMCLLYLKPLPPSPSPLRGGGWGEGFVPSRLRRLDADDARLGHGEIDLDGLRGAGLADVAGLVNRLDTHVELIRHAARHRPDELTLVVDAGRLGNRRPLALVELGRVGDGDGPLTEVLVGRLPADRQLAAVGAAADDHVANLHRGLGQIDLDPDLRLLALLRRLLAQIDAAASDQREAVSALGANIDHDRRIAARVGGLESPVVAIACHPDLDCLDARRPDIIDLVVQADARAVHLAKIARDRGVGTALVVTVSAMDRGALATDPHGCLAEVLGLVLNLKTHLDWSGSPRVPVELSAPLPRNVARHPI